VVSYSRSRLGIYHEEGKMRAASVITIEKSRLREVEVINETMISTVQNPRESASRYDLPPYM
jgi:hypothetical protein